MTPSTATAAPAPKRTRPDTVEIDERQWQALMAPPVTGRPFMGHANRRKQDRLVVREVAQLFLAVDSNRPGGARFLVRTRNISRGGVGFHHSRPLRRGTHCQVRILTRHEKIIELPGVVASCFRCDDGTFSLGVMFKSSADVHDFVAPARRPE